MSASRARITDTRDWKTMAGDDTHSSTADGSPVGTPSGQAMRVVGIVLACSTPISGLLAYAFTAILFGESRLEGGGGLTGLGVAVVASPLILGVALAVWNPKPPSQRSAGMAAAMVAVVFAALGFWSTSVSATAGDASIGGGILVLAAIPVAAGAVALLWTQC